MDPGTLRRRVPSLDQQKEVFEVSTKPPSAAVSTGHSELRSLLIHSVVFAVVIPSLISYSGGEQVRASWTLSLFVILYLFGCSVSYSTSSTPLAKMFFALSYVGLLAFVVHTLFSSVLGVVFIYSDSILAAGLFGSVLAQHREVNGRETAAAVAFSKAPFTRIYYRQDGIYPFLAFFALFGAICWVMRPEGHYDALTTVMNLFAAIACLEFILTVCVLGWLNGAVFGMDSAPPVVFIFAAIGMQFPISYLLGGKLVAAIILWLCVLASTAFLGYYLRVHATYEQMMFTRDAMKIRNARTIRNSAGVVPTKSNTPTPATASFTKETNTDASAAAVSP
ncbi:uncharacterized protein LOC124667278 isoform X2 [Lolium rigidum]|uniref:uncharacterized protein LOC124667099 isoform X2 n=1 Tax=Lolium rigidum TaxID=89674 RepID=UPI001F5D178D|nr:uncharacterized protein LOC124667099 isoform X2 [Lolium rigidum]XP_047060537.1 uncharacterized protein LOC124667278 isoform X2 [Lolium rigidum]